MVKRLRYVVQAASALLLIVPGIAFGQYMYLDVNDDGENTAADTLGTSGTFSVGIWLITNRDGNGAVSTCPQGGDLTLNSYEVILRSSGGSVRWDGYQNAQSGMDIPLESRSEGSDFHFGYAGGEILAPGKYHLGTVTLSVDSGTPSMTIVPGTPLGATYHTSFGSACASADDDNTMELGIDWFDVGGVSPGRGYGDQQPQTLSTSGGGKFFLGGNDIPGPWTLTKVRGVVSANGLAFSPPAALPPALTQEESELSQFLLRAGALADSLNRAGVDPSRGVKYLAQFCSSNKVGVRVQEVGNSVVLRLRNGLRIEMRMGLVRTTVPNSIPVPRKEMDYGRLQQVAAFLQAGCIVFVVDEATTVVVPASLRDEALRTVTKLKTSATLSAKEQQLLPAQVQVQVRNPVTLVRESGGGK